MADQEDDFLQLPLTDRLVHKNWKARQSAYKDLESNFKSYDFSIAQSNPDLFAKAVVDSNIAAQEAAIAALLTFLQNADSALVLRLAPSFLPGLCEKGLVATRPSTKSNTAECLLQVSEHKSPEMVINCLLDLYSHKLAKVIAASVSATTAQVTAFGANNVNVKAILELMPKLFSHMDKNVRAEASKLAVELYKWLGTALTDILLPSLKPVQQKDLTETFQALPAEKPVPTRQFKAAKASGANSDIASSAADDPMEVDGAPDLDPFDLMEAKPVHVPAVFYSQITEVKWSLRKEAIEGLQKELEGKPKIASGDYLEVISALAKCVAKDANVVVVTLSAQSIASFAKGLKGSFSQYRPIVTSPLLERLKEKKQNVSQALTSALEATFLATSLSDMLDDILSACGHKTPNVKIETLNFLVRCLSQTKSSLSSASVQQIAEMAVQRVTDTDENVRNSAAQVLGTLMKMMGRRVVEPFITSLPQMRKDKIYDYCEKAEVKLVVTAAPAAVPQSKGNAKTIPTARNAPKSIGSPRVGTASPTKPLQRPAGVGRPISSMKPRAEMPPSPTKRALPTSDSPMKKGEGMKYGGKVSGLTGRSLVSKENTTHDPRGASPRAKSGAAALSTSAPISPGKMESLVKENAQMKAAMASLESELATYKSKLAKLELTKDAEKSKHIQSTTVTQAQVAELVAEKKEIL
ncbi:hypothetical protein CANCADRAFT_32132, partial [Tortispora caseinolytica NRRL Y-17796]